MIKPIHILILYIIGSVIVHFYNELFYIVNEIILLTMLVPFLKLAKGKVNKLAVYTMIALGFVNIIALIFGIDAFYYSIGYFTVLAWFFSMILHLKLNERID